MTLPAQKQLRHVFSVTSGATPESGNPEYWDGDICWATPEDISSLDGYHLWDTRRKITRSGYESCGTTTAPRGSIILSKRAPIGQVAVLAEEACSNQGCFLLTPRHDTDTRYYYYWLAVQTGYLQVLGRGSTFMELSTDELKSLVVPHPSLKQQRAIADFLDCETTRLDALRAAKERVLLLLSEKRRALITRAVTRGIDRRAALRDTGIPWLGKVPAHWEVKRLKRISPFITVGVVVNPSTYVTEDGVPFLYGSDITEEGINIDSARRLLPEVSRGELAKTCLKGGDIVTVRVGAPGITAVVPPELDGANCASIMLVRGAPSFDSNWLAYAMNSSVGKHQVALVQYGAAQEQFNISHAVDFDFAVPPLIEQQSIVSYVNDAARALDALREATTRTINLIKERRAALIAAAVTGQLAIKGVS